MICRVRGTLANTARVYLQGNTGSGAMLIKVLSNFWWRAPSADSYVNKEFAYGLILVNHKVWAYLYHILDVLKLIAETKLS